MNKKGNVWDSLDAITLVSAMVIFLVILGMVLKGFYSEGEAQEIFVGDAYEPSIDYVDNWGSRVDWVAPVLLFGLMMASLIFAFKIPSNSVFFVISFIAIPFIGLMIMIVGEMTYGVISDTAVSTLTNTMPITLFMFQGNHPLIAGIIYVLLTYVALYAGKDE